MNRLSRIRIKKVKFSVLSGLLPLDDSAMLNWSNNVLLFNNFLSRLVRLNVSLVNDVGLGLTLE